MKMIDSVYPKDIYKVITHFERKTKCVGWVETSIMSIDMDHALSYESDMVENWPGTVRNFRHEVR